MNQDQERFRVFADLVPVCFAESDAQGRITFINRAGVALHGFADAAAALGTPVIELLHPDDRPRALENFRRRRRGEDVQGVEYRFVRVDGVEYPGLLIARVERDGRRLGTVQAVVVDLSDRRAAEEARARLEAKVQHAQKIDSLGVLAGGVAHDFNNLLAAILGNAELALASLSPWDAARRPVERIHTASRRAGLLTAQMLAYAGAAHVDAAPVDLAAAVAEMADLLRATLSRGARVSFSFPDDLPRVQGDAARIQQIVLNLLTNASEALGDAPGDIRCAAWRAEVPGPRAPPEPLASGAWVVLEVADTGEGMDEATRQRIFDPFFSTRFSGRGLGLAAVMGIVRAHQGAIEVETAKGRGSTFRVWLPAAEALPARPDAPPEVEAWHGSGKVLLVDDEPDVREVACALLQHAGFDVIATGDGAEALALYDRERDGLVVVILDLTMPPPSGPEIHAALEQRGNTVPVVVTSGYLAREALARFSPPGPEAFLHKPFGLADLEGALRRVLRPPPTLVRGGHLL